jgi:hypothetical protein
MRGVGPADKTGNSVVTYCPGGSFLSPALPRPAKPREMIAIRYSPFRPKYRAVRLIKIANSKESNSDLSTDQHQP